MAAGLRRKRRCDHGLGGDAEANAFSISTLEKLAADARRRSLEPPAIVVIGEIVKVARAACVGEEASPTAEADMNARGLIVAAPHSGAGKTTVTLALLRGAAAARRRRRAAKAGPDYIDPAFPCGGDWHAERQSRYLGDAGQAARRARCGKRPTAPTSS